MDTFDALADPVRRDLVLAVAVAPTTAGELAARHPSISRPAVSRHLRVLTETGVLVAAVVGRHRVFRLAPRGLAEVRSFLDAAGAAPASRVADAFDALDTEVARTRRERRRTEVATDEAAGRTPSPGPVRGEDPADEERTA
ncbi:ArsR/SmtB family transcription factor [Nitriliruptor alkaliphilus]|uniref:ArsR/SmtB family transcription factor n=1 Tax=Nitriliruptor alkaliphilus TaxID=427918 RepID=UPI0009FB256A|nr:metalloregulator ArsR/SmtB family transcription factor [Nitriliruptor alkaliphilus]